MPRWKVLLTDCAWPDLELERRILAEADAELVVATQQDEPTLASLAADADAIMTTWAKVTRSVIAAAERCQIVARLGIGLDNIDVAFCSQRRIPVTNVPDYCLTEVAEHALALLLSLGRKVAWYHQQTKAGRYQLQGGCTLRRIEGQTLGIVGLGAIGRTLADKALGIGMRVVATTRRPQHSMRGIRYCGLDELLGCSDYVSLHLPLTPETRHRIGARELGLMKPTAFLINTARGGLIDQAALACALEQGQLAGAALDVQEPEPPDLSQPPWNDPRVIVTPHAAFVSVESLQSLRCSACRQVTTRLRGGMPDHVVNDVAC